MPLLRVDTLLDGGQGAAYMTTRGEVIVNAARSEPYVK